MIRIQFLSSDILNAPIFLKFHLQFNITCNTDFLNICINVLQFPVALFKHLLSWMHVLPTAINLIRFNLYNTQILITVLIQTQNFYVFIKYQFLDTRLHGLSSTTEYINQMSIVIHFKNIAQSKLSIDLFCWSIFSCWVWLEISSYIIWDFPCRFFVHHILLNIDWG